MNKKIIKTFNFEGQEFKFEIGEFAPRANAAVFATLGETVVLVTATMSYADTDKDYFPLSVEFIEKFYASGMISGSRFVKRERFPSDEAILKARMIDRSIRSLFPNELKRDVQIIATVLSYDGENDPLILSINATSLALMISDIPFEGPITGVRIGQIDNKLIINPQNSQLEKSLLNLVVSGANGQITMIDADGKEVEEKYIEDAFELASKSFDAFNKFQIEVQREIGKEKIKIEKNENEKELFNLVFENYKERLEKVIFELKGSAPEQSRSPELKAILDEILEKNGDKYSAFEISEAISKVMKKQVRQSILIDKKRPSGRAFNEIRKISCRIGVLPRTHGSAFFARGITQVLSIVTLGSTSLEQTLESIEGETTKRFLHHYNGAGFSLGSTEPYKFSPGRREIGHGALAEKALKPVIPSEDEFPYTIRVVSEILSQQGSSSMASTCGSTLALIDAGVPIKSPVAGIAIGLVTSEDGRQFELLTDMQDLEDFFGDMDFKVAGTAKGITAIQMDNKLKGVKIEILKKALYQAKEGREKILKIMSEAIPKEKKGISKFAPKISKISISPSKIAEVIGPGGKVIREIIEKTGAEIDIKDDGTVFIASVNAEDGEKAITMIKEIAMDGVEVGQIYKAVVSKVMPYGLFVNISRSISGLVHISELGKGFIKEASQVANEGDTVFVKVKSIANDGKISLTMKNIDQKTGKQL